MKKQIALILVLMKICVTQVAVYKKFIVDDKDALCLDGSQGVYYFSEGTSQTKFMIFFDGGAWCGDYDLPSTIESCYQRSFTDLGSSKNYPNNMIFPAGILSLNPSNPFKDFTKVYFKYCDGSGHQGTKSEPI